MASVISASTTSATALNLSGDTTGVLQIATGATPTTAVTINTSQNVGIGNTNPRAPLSFAESAGTAGEPNKIRFYDNGGVVTYGIGISNAQQNYVVAGGGAHCFYVGDLGSATERMRIDSSGNVLINSTSAIRARIGQMQIKAVSTQEALTTSSNDLSYAHWAARSADAGAGTHYLGYFENSSGTNVGAITHNNTNTSYTTSSDYRLKENIVPMTGALAIVQALKPVTYNWKSDGSDGQGFIAHELQEVVPDCVSGEKDAVNEDGSIKAQGVDTSFLVATLTAAIQEMKAIIDEQSVTINDLKTRIETLEAK